MSPHRHPAATDGDPLGAAISQARDAVRATHATMHRDLDSARLSIDGVGHALVPTRVIGVDLPRILEAQLGPTGAGPVMYDVGRETGARHASAFLDGSTVPDDVRLRLLTGALQLAHCGYGDVDVLICRPHLDDRFAVLWESGTSCCAGEALADGRRRRACHLLAGWSAGWGAHATGLPLAAVELSCRAEGVARCRFLLALADLLDDHLRDEAYHRPTAQYANRAPVRSARPD